MTVNIMKYIRETDIENHLIKEIKKAGGIAYKFISPGKHAVPDRLVLLPGGRVLFVECKAPGQKPTPAQLREHTKMRALGFEVVVLDNKTLEGIV